jgi:hypothetical protein
LEGRSRLKELREYFSLLSLILFCVRVGFACIWALGFEWFSPYYSFLLHLLLVNFFQIISANGCKLIKPNHLNLGIFCVIDLFSIMLFSTSLGILNSFVTINWYQSLCSLFCRMASAKFEVEKFDGQNSFCLWRIKMRALLRQQDLPKILDGKASSTSSSEKIAKLEEKAIVQFCCLLQMEF